MESLLDDGLTLLRAPTHNTHAVHAVDAGVPIHLNLGYPLRNRITVDVNLCVVIEDAITQIRITLSGGVNSGFINDRLVFDIVTIERRHGWVMTKPLGVSDFDLYIVMSHDLYYINKSWLHSSIDGWSSSCNGLYLLVLFRHGLSRILK